MRRGCLFLAAVALLAAIVPSHAAFADGGIATQAQAAEFLDQVNSNEFDAGKYGLEPPQSTWGVAGYLAELGELVEQAARYVGDSDPRVVHADLVLAGMYLSVGRNGDARKLISEARNRAEGNPAGNAANSALVAQGACLLDAEDLAARRMHDPNADSSDVVRTCEHAHDLLSAQKGDSSAVDGIVEALQGLPIHDRSGDDDAFSATRELQRRSPERGLDLAYRHDAENDYVAVQQDLAAADDKIDGFFEELASFKEMARFQHVPEVSAWLSKYDRAQTISGFLVRAWLADVQASAGDEKSARKSLARLPALVTRLDERVGRDVPEDYEGNLCLGIADAADAARQLKDVRTEDSFIGRFGPANCLDLPSGAAGAHISAYSLMTSVVYQRNNAPGRDLTAYPFARAAAVLADRILEQFIEQPAGYAGNYSLGGVRGAMEGPLSQFLYLAAKLNKDPELAFRAAQWLRSTEAGIAMREAAVRFAANTPHLRDLAGDRNRIATALDALAAEKHPQTDSEEVSQDSRRRSLIAQLEEIDTRVRKEFPKYQELLMPAAVPADRIQKLLRDDEALVVYSASHTDIRALVVRRRGPVAIHLLQPKISEVQDSVRLLRTALQLKNGELPLPFNLEASYDLYTKIFAPIESDLSGANRLYVVSDGPLESLPLALLVQRQVPAGSETDRYRSAQWLGLRFAFVTLPDVGSFNLLRTTAFDQNWSAQFMGFGNPVLAPPDTPVDSPTTVVEGGGAPMIARLPSVPDTQDQLVEVGSKLGATAGDYFFARRDTESALKETNEEGALLNRRVLMIATHSVQLGQAAEKEPALVFTPPQRPTDADDGLLRASEAALLRLNADLVILSACDTADSSEGSRPLSGLSRAFFAAGAHSLLVSHWPVDSKATRVLMENAVSPTDKAGALQAAMKQMIQDPSGHYAHPAYWAPFVLVGDGR
jgi:CHAT domain-containing protein